MIKDRDRVNLHMNLLTLDKIVILRSTNRKL